MFIFFLMIRRPPRSTRTDTLFPDTTLFRSGAGAAAQLQRAVFREARGLQLGDLLQQDLARRRILVAQVDVAALAADRPGGDQRALEEAVRIALQVEAVLEGAGLALVGVDRHQARPLEAAHDLPLLAGREAGAAEAAQADRKSTRLNSSH